MGIIILHDGMDIWSPALTVGRLFLAEARALEDALGLESGFSKIVSDEVTLDTAVLRAFLERLVEWLGSTNNGPLTIMCAGWLQVALALYASAPGVWIELPAPLRSLEKGARQALLPEAPFTLLQAHRDFSSMPARDIHDWTVSHSEDGDGT